MVPMFDTSAILLPPGAKAPANTPWPATELSVTGVPAPQSDAWVENGTRLLNSISPKLAPLFWVPSTRIVVPSGDQSTWPPRSHPAAEVQLGTSAVFEIVAKQSCAAVALRSMKAMSAPSTSARTPG